MRSRTGCLTCRQRKLKCGEEKPKCAQCTKAQRECVPSSGITFRHQHNASMNAGQGDNGSNLPNYFAYKNTFKQGTEWVKIPKQVTFVHTTDPYNDTGSPDIDHLDSFSSPPSSMHDAAHGREPIAPSEPPDESASKPTQALDTLSAVAIGEAMNEAIDMSLQSMSPAGLIAGLPERSTSVVSPQSTRSRTSEQPFAQASVQNSHLNFILNHPTPISPPVDPDIQSPADRRLSNYTIYSSPLSRSKSTPLDENIESDHEIAFLLRYFSEGPGFWMDLFDLGLYFSFYVPVKAADHGFLKYAAAACAAKALSRIYGRRPTFGGNASHLASTEQYPNCRAVDWSHKGAEHYRTAVKLLREALHEDYQKHLNDHPDVEDIRDNNGQDLGEGSNKRRRLSNLPSNTYRTNSDELLAATAILCVYEFLDASNAEWSGHLNGAKSLIDVVKERMMPLQQPSPSASIIRANGQRISKARKATFWNIARQDMLAAFINETHTRLDAEDLDLWREAGLLIDEEGFVVPSNTTESGYPEGDGVMREDMISNALIWLMFRLINFMAAGDDVPAEVGGPWLGIPQRSLLDYWNHLKHQFQVWYNGLPSTFKPIARISPPNAQSPCNELNEVSLPEVWYSIPMCASTMQTYHMSQILLLSNKPHESTQGRTTVHARLYSYEKTISDSQKHSREIVSISLARCDASVRIHSLQPLYTAGQCLTDPRERRLIVRLLRDVELDTGWATEYRVRQLLQQWSWDQGAADQGT